MGEIATLSQRNLVDFTPKQLELIKRTVAADCNNDEFSLFIEVARSRGLNPFLKQIYAFVYSKDDAKKRKMSIVTGIDGYRIIAARCRDYRPDDQAPRFEIDDAKKSSENPLGIVKAVVSPYKLGADGNWYAVPAEAYWDEYCPLEYSDDDFEWIDTGEKWPDSGKPKMRKQAKKRSDGAEAKRIPSGLWGKMGRNQIAKCAEALSLRKGWPEDFSGIHVDAEMDRARFDDMTASEAVEQFERDKRLQLVHAKDCVTVQWAPADPLEAVPVGQFMDRAIAFVKASETVPDLVGWQETNRVALQQFWAMHKSDALELKKLMEGRVKELAEASRA